MRSRAAWSLAQRQSLRRPPHRLRSQRVQPSWALTISCAGLLGTVFFRSLSQDFIFVVSTASVGLELAPPRPSQPAAPQACSLQCGCRPRARWSRLRELRDAEPFLFLVGSLAGAGAQLPAPDCRAPIAPTASHGEWSWRPSGLL